MASKHYERGNDIMRHKHNGDHRTSCLNMLKVYDNQWEKGCAGLLKIITRCTHLVTNSLGGRNSLCCIIIIKCWPGPRSCSQWLDDCSLLLLARQLVILTLSWAHLNVQRPLEINFDTGQEQGWGPSGDSVPRLLFTSAPANNENDETVKDGQWWWG